jgi:hypothetical protein
LARGRSAELHAGIIDIASGLYKDRLQTIALVGWPILFAALMR